jgi:hypothetical protein
VLAALLSSERDAVAEPLPQRWLPSGSVRPSGAGVQLLPGGEANGDAFYYACLTRHERQY